MQNNMTPFPGGDQRRPRAPGPAKPPLPMMDHNERKLWAASHNLPEGILLIYEQEMRMIQSATVGTVAELRKWKAVGRALAGVVEAEKFFDIAQPLLQRLKVLEETGLPLANGDLVTAERAVVLLDAARADLDALREEVRQLRAHVQGEVAP